MGLQAKRDDSRYRSPKEISLQNAADSLGVTVGDYYPEDVDLLQHLEAWRENQDEPARLDASREELLAYIEGLRVKRERRRREWRWRMATLCAIAALVIVVGVTWIADLGGAPESSKPDVRVAMRDRWRALTPATASGRGVPSPRQSGVSNELPYGRLRIVGSAYVDLTGHICLSDAIELDGVAKTYGAGGCVSSSRLSADLRRTPVVLAAYSGLKRHVLLQGFARFDVKRIVVRRPGNSGEIAISGPWTPGSRRSGVTPIRLVTIKVSFDAINGRLQSIREDVMRRRWYELAVELYDGRVSRVRSLWGVGNAKPPRISSTQSSRRRLSSAGTFASLTLDNWREIRVTSRSQLIGPAIGGGTARE